MEFLIGFNNQYIHFNFKLKHFNTDKVELSKSVFFIKKVFSLIGKYCHVGKVEI